jgi:hypothetical protein
MLLMRMKMTINMAMPASKPFLMPTLLVDAAIF